MTVRITLTCDGCGDERFIGGNYFDVDEHLTASQFLPVGDGQHLCPECARKVLAQRLRKEHHL